MKIPQCAKDAARKGFAAREIFPRPLGLTKEQAAAMGINSGVEHAKQLIATDTLTDEGLA